MKEYIEREAVCNLCNNKEEYCGKEKCPVYKAPAADVVERKSSDTGETESKPHKWLRGEAALAKAILDTIPGAYALCRHTDGHPYLDSAWDCLDTILVLIHGEESQTLFSPHYFPSLRPNEQVALEYIINNADMREVDHEGVH